MTGRAFKRLPPWVFTSRARSDQLVCDPRSYVRAWQEDGRALWAPCLAWAPGPLTLASTGDGSYPTLFGENWLLQICEDGSWVLYRRDGNETLTVVPWDVIPPVASLSARHPTLAFDQAARPAMAWEDDAGIHLREFNEVSGVYDFVGPFVGVDPVLLMDATVNYHVPGSDVVLFYLSSDRSTLQYRVQSENYLTEHDHLVLEEAIVLDAPDVGGYQFQLRHSNEQGGVIDADDTFRAILSDAYPVYALDELPAVVGSLEDGAYQLVVLKQSATESVTGAVGSLGDGVLFSVILQRDEVVEALTGAVGSLGDGALVSVILQRAAVTEGVTGSVGSLGDGVLFFVIIQRDAVIEAITGSVGSLGDGAYVAI